MKILVNIKNYTTFKYDVYLHGGTRFNNPYVVGQVVAVKQEGRTGEKNERLGVVLGCITEHEVRVDTDGMVPIEDIRPATVTDFGKSNVKYMDRLYKECQGLPVMVIHEPSKGLKYQESLWYYGMHIATVRKGDKTFIVEATGEQRIFVDKTGTGDFEDLPRHDNEFATEKAVKAKLTDADLLNDDKVHHEMNSWFAIRELDTEGNATDDVAICHGYLDAIQKAFDEMNNPSKDLIIQEK